MKYVFAPLLAILFFALPAQATTIQEVTSKGGIHAWLVEDHALPLIAMRLAFRGGLEQDPADKQGLSTMTMNLLTQGAGPYNAEQYQQQLADHSIQIGFEAGRDALMGSVKCLSQDRALAFNLLQLAVTRPHFEADEVTRMREQQLTALRMQLGSPDWQGRYALFQQIFGSHPYGERRLGSIETLSHITRGDLQGFAATHLAQDNLIVAVAGDITPRELSKLLDQVFLTLPKHAKLTPVSEVVWPKDPAVISVPREGTQTELMFALPGPKRDNPDWYAAEIANYILGGGGFQSRLMEDVRNKRGLTYGIETSLSPMEHGGLIVGEAATDNDKAGQAWDVILTTMRHFYQDGASDKEIQAAKDYLTGALPLAMTSTDRIASLLVDLQLEHMGMDYLDRREEFFRRVSADDVDRVIHDWFNPDNLSLSMVGKPQGITPTKTQDLTRN